MRTPPSTIAVSAGEDCITVAAEFLATEPEAVTRALDTHRNSADGRCTGCRTRPVSWPCSTATIAVVAETLLARRSR